MICVAAALLFFGVSYSQDSKKLLLDQFNVQSFGSDAPAEAKATIEKDEDLTLFNLSNYKYTVAPQQGKEYKEYQAIKLDGLSNLEIITGMITNTLDRENRFIELTEGKQQIAMVREALNGRADYVFVSPLEKEYFIDAQGTFRYIDGRELVGDKKVKIYLEKGKPITATTFFFALKDRGLISLEVGLRQFISMSTDEKVSLLRMDIYTAPKETESASNN